LAFPAIELKAASKADDMFPRRMAFGMKVGAMAL
jgi:hypothetical protein